MKTEPFVVAGAARPVHFLDRADEVDVVGSWLRSSSEPVAVDVETTGLDIYAPAFQVRTVQFGRRDQAFVLPATLVDLKQILLLAADCGLLVHNAAFDLLVLDRFGLLDLDTGFAATTDTRILAHLLDPRAESEGGTGHGLKALSTAYFDPDAADAQTDLFKAFHQLGFKKRVDGFAGIPVDHPAFIRYAGADVILTAFLHEALAPLVLSDPALKRLAEFEHRVAAACARMQRRGLLLDVPYAFQAMSDFERIEVEAKARAASFGVENVNSPKQVGAVLKALGADLVEFTDAGQPKVDKAVLEALVANHEGKPLGIVADAVYTAKNAGKWRTSYLGASLDLRDADDRVHPFINSLQARTGRMSIERPPLQQLPSRDWRIRRAFVADPGHALISCDYSQVEMRVLAALCEDRQMLHAINTGVDLHDFTAELVFGPGFTKAQRKLAKAVGFGKVYGGGAKTIARQSGCTLADAKRAVEMYDRSFPGVKRYGRKLTEKAEYGEAAVVTPSGRRLPLDRDRTYAATNYVVQSTARDVLAQALLDLEDAGLGQYLLLPIHDEVLASAPVAEAEEVAQAIERTMTMSFGPVELAAEGEVIGRSWGAAYGAPEGA